MLDQVLPVLLAAGSQHTLCTRVAISGPELRDAFRGASVFRRWLGR